MADWAKGGFERAKVGSGWDFAPESVYNMFPPVMPDSTPVYTQSQQVNVEKPFVPSYPWGADGIAAMPDTKPEPPKESSTIQSTPDGGAVLTEKRVTKLQPKDLEELRALGRRAQEKSSESQMNEGMPPVDPRIQQRLQMRDQLRQERGNMAPSDPRIQQRLQMRDQLRQESGGMAPSETSIYDDPRVMQRELERIMLQQQGGGQ